MADERDYSEEFYQGFTKGYNRYEKASWKNIRRVLPAAASRMISLDKDIPLLYDSFEQYGYATSIWFVSLMNYPGDVFSQEVLYKLLCAVCANLDPRAKTELQAILETKLRVFLDRNDPMDSAVISKMTKLKQNYFS